MVCSWSSAGFWPRAQALERKSQLVLVVVQLLALTWPRAPTQEQRWPQGEEAKSRIQRLQPGLKSQNTEPEIQAPKGLPSQKPTGMLVLEPAERSHLRCQVWSPRRVAERPYVGHTPTRLVPTCKTSEYKHPLLYPPPGPF